MRYTVSATYDHDWIHFLIEAGSHKEAVEIAKKYYPEYMVDDTQDIVKTWRQHPEIKDLCVDYHDIEWGKEEFVYEDYNKGVRVYTLTRDEEGHLAVGLDYHFDTYEEAEAEANKLKATRGEAWSVDQTKGRGWGFCVTNTNPDDEE